MNVVIMYFRQMTASDFEPSQTCFIMADSKAAVTNAMKEPNFCAFVIQILHPKCSIYLCV